MENPSEFEKIVSVLESFDKKGVGKATKILITAYNIRAAFEQIGLEIEFYRDGGAVVMCMSTTVSVKPQIFAAAMFAVLQIRSRVEERGVKFAE